VLLLLLLLLLLPQVAAIGGVWRDVARLPEPQLAQLIRQDEIDILVELTGVGLQATKDLCF
jgi:predicted O-linked N-acetylglucosamine transferase (SPINDLY family)